MAWPLAWVPKDPAWISLINMPNSCLPMHLSITMSWFLLYSTSLLIKTRIACHMFSWGLTCFIVVAYAFCVGPHDSPLSVVRNMNDEKVLWKDFLDKKLDKNAFIAKLYEFSSKTIPPLITLARVKLGCDHISYPYATPISHKLHHYTIPLNILNNIKPISLLIIFYSKLKWILDTKRLCFNCDKQYHKFF